VVLSRLPRLYLLSFLFNLKENEEQSRSGFTSFTFVLKFVRNTHILFTLQHIPVDTGLDTYPFRRYNGKSPMR
jgi:hypothetical protein